MPRPWKRSVRAGSALAAGTLALALGLGACSTTPEEPEPTWSSELLVAPSETLLWEATLDALIGLAYPVGADADSNGLEVTTGWKNHLSPFRARGYRLQAVVRMVPNAEVVGGWDVDVRVRRQINMTLVKPLSPAHAEWEWVEDDFVEASILLTKIRAAFPVQDIYGETAEGAGAGATGAGPGW